MKCERLLIEYGDIVDDTFLREADVIVNPSNPMMRQGGGVSGAIFNKAGVEELEKYCRETFNIVYVVDSLINTMEVTEIRVTPGFNLPCDIIFAQGPNDIFFPLKREEFLPLLKKTYENIFKVCEERNYKTIILPSLGTGIYGIPHDVASKIMFKTSLDFLNRNKEARIIVVMNNLKNVNEYQQTLEKILNN